ncbi:MAG: serine hydrolase domain-containing protein [Anaerolineae bacterium]
MQLQDRIREAAGPVLAHYKVPGVVIVAAKEEQAPVATTIGLDAAGNELARDSLFPVASITKLATALAVLRLVDTGFLALDAPLACYLPDAAAALPGVTLRTLLSHSSGLPQDINPDAAPYVEGLTWAAVAQVCLQTPLAAPPLTRVLYSNAGYGLLAIVVERTTGDAFRRALARLVLDPLGIEGYLGVEPPRAPIALADVRGSSKGTPREPYTTPFWRSLAFPWGGLDTTADGALALVRAFAGIPAGFLSASLRAEAVRNQTGDLPGGYGGPFMYARCPWGLGPDLHADKKPHWAPDGSSPDVFGHAGASGCVAWYDPARAVAWAILGSRTADNGWLLRGTPAIGQAILDAA